MHERVIVLFCAAVNASRVVLEIVHATVIIFVETPVMERFESLVPTGSSIEPVPEIASPPVPLPAEYVAPDASMATSSLIVSVWLRLSE